MIFQLCYSNSKGEVVTLLGINCNGIHGTFLVFGVSICRLNSFYILFHSICKEIINTKTNVKLNFSVFYFFQTIDVKLNRRIIVRLL